MTANELRDTWRAFEEAQKGAEVRSVNPGSAGMAILTVNKRSILLGTRELADEEAIRVRDALIALFPLEGAEP